MEQILINDDKRYNLEELQRKHNIAFFSTDVMLAVGLELQNTCEVLALGPMEEVDYKRVSDLYDLINKSILEFDDAMSNKEYEYDNCCES
ncbi:MAG: hypothetical protein ACRC6B_08120 [Fusobacteriaceae bacterium]